MRLRRLLSRYESTSLPAELLAAELPDDAGNQDDLRTLALLRWHRYRNLPGVEGVPERWALQKLIRRLDECPAELRHFADRTGMLRRVREVDGVLDRGRVDRLTALMARHHRTGDLASLSTVGDLCVEWGEQSQLAWEVAALYTCMAEGAHRYALAGARRGFEAAEARINDALRLTPDHEPVLVARLVLHGRYAEGLGFVLLAADAAGATDAWDRGLESLRLAADRSWAVRPPGLEAPRLLAAALMRLHRASGTTDPLLEALTLWRDLARTASSSDPQAEPDTSGLALATREARAAVGVARVDEILSDNLEDDWAREIDEQDPVASVNRAMELVPWPSERRAEVLRIGAEILDDVSRPGEALLLADRAALSAPPGHARRGRTYATLASLLADRARENRDEDRALAALQAVRVAAELLPQDDPHSAVPLSECGFALQAVAQLLGDSTMLPEVVTLFRSAVRSTRPGDEQLPFRLANLGNAVTDLARARHDQSLLDEVIGLRRTALDALPPDAPHREGLLFNLATALYDYFWEPPGGPQLTESLRNFERGRVLLPPGHPDLPRFDSSMALVLRALHQRTGDRGALERAVGLARDAVAATSPEHHWWAERQGALARCCAELSRLRAGTPSGRALAQEALRAYAIAVTDPVRTPLHRLRIGEERAVLAGEAGNHELALQACVDAVAEIPTAVRRSLTGQVRLQTVRQIGELAVVAATAGIVAGRPERALELLEQARAMLFTQALDGFTVRQALRNRNPATADRLSKIDQALAMADVDTAVGPLTVTVGAGGREATETIDLGPGAAEWIRGLAAERDKVLAEITGIEALLRPPTIAHLRKQITGRPVVVLVAGPDRGHALIVPARPGNPIVHVPLPALSRDEVVRQVETLVTAVSRASDPNLPFDRREAAQEELHGVLAWLWDTAAGPVLKRLGKTPARLWWCPVGPLTRLPITAAGHHLDGSSRTLLDRGISSVTPTLAALAHAATAGRSRTGPGSEPLVVAVPRAPGMPILPQAAAEAEAVAALLPGARLLAGDDATMPAVEAAVRTARIVHFACHGDADTRMSEIRGGGLHLADGQTLSASHLQGVRTDNGDLAFLSACDTAQPHSGLPDEPLHMTAAFLIAGFRAVVGTLWTTPDTANLARAVYADLTHEGQQQADTARAAEALNRAVRELRDRYPAVPTRWAGHLHTGL